jgi:phosphatidylglycerophosphate synthase
MTLAIKITLIRFPITIVILILLYQKSEVGYSLALVFFILGMLSDILDGYVARKWDQTSEIGGSLDLAYIVLLWFSRCSSGI